MSNSRREDRDKELQWRAAMKVSRMKIRNEWAFLLKANSRKEFQWKRYSDMLCMIAP